MNLHRSLLPIALALILLAPPASSAPYDNHPKILLHVAGTTTKNACDWGNLADCRDAVTAGGLYASNGSNYVYLLVARGDMPNVAGFTCGITYNLGRQFQLNQQKLHMFGWTLCATLEFPTPSPGWPKPGSGNLITWDSQNRCQAGEVAVAGYFYTAAYTADTLKILPRPVDGQALLANCCAQTMPALGGSALGSAIFSSGATLDGCNPCDGPCPGTVVSPTGYEACTTPTPPPPPPPPPSTGLPEAALLLHIGAPVSKNACAAGQLADPADAVTEAGLSSPSGPFHFVYLLAAKAISGDITGLQCGISYENNLPGDDANGSGIDIFDWVLCADLQFITTGPNQWPKPGGGNLITWVPETNCQTGATAVAGYFYLAAYSSDRLLLTPRPVDGAAKVANCSAAEIPVSEDHLGFVMFSDETNSQGCNPWLLSCVDAVPVIPATWSSIKTLYDE